MGVLAEMHAGRALAPVRDFDPVLSCKTSRGGTGRCKPAPCTLAHHWDHSPTAAGLLPGAASIPGQGPFYGRLLLGHAFLQTDLRSEPTDQTIPFPPRRGRPS